VANPPESGRGRPPALTARARARLLDRFQRAPKRLLLLDYDGTLRELAERPELAPPTGELTALLADLARLPRTELHLISGRTAETLERWFGEVDGLYLGAEHGYLWRPNGGGWQQASLAPLDWRERVEALFEQMSVRVAGTFVERKRAGLAWHYRQADPQAGRERARELQAALARTLDAADDAEVLTGHDVIEVRPASANKGRYAREALAAGGGIDTFVLAAGDDVTDLDLFGALPADAVALEVGGRLPPRAADQAHTSYALNDPAELRALLAELVERGRNATDDSREEAG
jgi:trehalose 6-phosphate synthase/phosphatase